MSVGAAEAAPAAPAEPVTPAPPAAAAPPEPARVPPGQPEGGQFAPQQQAPAPVQPAAPQQAAPPQAPPEPDWKAELDAARAELETAKADAARWKAQSRVQETRSKANHQRVQGLEGVVRQIAEKLEVPFDDQPDPAEVAKRLTESNTEVRQLRVERAIYLTAAKSNADANALLDSREFIAKTEQVDPEASDFADQVADLVREAARQPKYQLPSPKAPEPGLTPQQGQAPAQQQPADQFQQPAAQPPAQSSGADFSGAPGGNRKWTQSDYDYWTQPGRDRDGKVMAKAIEDGLLVDLGIGKPKRPARR